MTRINVGIPVKNLCDAHLLAEHREIKRIPFLYCKRLPLNKFNDIPDEFTLGTGHVKFFLDKGGYTYNRYQDLFHECIARGFEIQDYSRNWVPYKIEHFKTFNDYSYRPILEARIIERLQTMTGIRYFSKQISLTEAIKLLKQ